MTLSIDPMVEIESPWEVLGIPEEADEGRIRAAYLDKVKAFPPDRCGEQFERIRDAYQQLKDPLRIRMGQILGRSQQTPLASIMDEQPRHRHYVGPAAWLNLVKKEGQGGST